MIERLLSFASEPTEDPDSGLAARYGTVAIGPGDRAAAWIGSDAQGEALSDVGVQRGDGTLRVGPEVVLGLAAQTSALSFETGPDRGVTAQAIGVSADLGGGEGFEAVGVSWTFSGEGDQSAIRTLWASLADRGLLVMFGLRGPDASGHGTETIGAARIARDGSVTAYEEPLLSTEYDGAGRQTRATLELWGDGEETFAERGGGLRAGGGEAGLDSIQLRAARFDWRLDGAPGVGGYEIVST